MLTPRQSLAALLFGLSLLFFGSSASAQVDINTADAATLARELKGVGLKKAEAIVAYRQKHGPFRSADELALVKGIGPSLISKNRDSIRTDGKPAAGAAKPSASTRPAGAVRPAAPPTRSTLPAR
jgi:competence protein ComEA